MELRCWVAANPVNENAILQIDWLRDGAKLDEGSQVSIESSTHRLMGPRSQQLELPSGQSKVLASSSLVLSQISRQFSGLYGCQFRLIPSSEQQQRESSSVLAPRITSGKAKQTIQVKVIEGELSVERQIHVPPWASAGQMAPVKVFEYPWSDTLGTKHSSPETLKAPQ